MYATKLKGQITRDRRLVVEVPRDIAPGAVEVILMRLSPKPTRRRARRMAHPAFGVWAKRSDITDADSFASQLRERLETRADGDRRDQVAARNFNPR